VKISPRGIELIKEFEGLCLDPYYCPAGHLTVGYGHRLLPGEPSVPISEPEANQLLEFDLRRFEAGVAAMIDDVAVNQNQFDALVSFAFNLGLHRLAHSTLLKKLKAEDLEAAAKEFDRWVHISNSKGPMRSEGLVRRRAAERALFESELR
jgi:lysozyme